MLNSFRLILFSIQIIQLSEILSLATSYGSSNSISNVVTPSYYFLFVTAKLTYFVGAPSDEVLFENGVGEELAKFWEKAISEALQPNSIMSDSLSGMCLLNCNTYTIKKYYGKAKFILFHQLAGYNRTSAPGPKGYKLEVKEAHN